MYFKYIIYLFGEHTTKEQNCIAFYIILQVNAFWAFGWPFVIYINFMFGYGYIIYLQENKQYKTNTRIFCFKFFWLYTLESVSIHGYIPYIHSIHIYWAKLNKKEM